MTVGQFELQTAVYSALSGDSNLTSTLGASVFDEVPDQSSFPFVALGEETVVPYDTFDLDGASHTLNIHIWSQYKGAKQTKQIMDRIHTLLHDSSLSVSGFNLIRMQFEFSDIMRDPDGVTRHGVMRFRAITLGTTS
jgi:hypothetical protein|tara:strand:+ start:2140 stop:2550 length:411 start_codon:yes stop_codon:yes gene_type:complete